MTGLSDLSLSRFALRSVVLALILLSWTSVCTVAQSSLPAKAGSGTEILFLGTAGGPPLRESRSEPSTLLIVDGRPYLIDCGIGTMRRMLQAGIQSEQIKTIFFTHLHPDHALGLADIMANDFFRLNAAHSASAISIYGPPQTKELVDTAFHYITISFRPFAAQDPSRYRMVNQGFASPFVTHEIDRPGVAFQDDKIRVTAADNSHYALLPPAGRHGMKSYSYRIDTPHGVIVFTGDTGPSEAVVGLANRADVLVAEVSYRDPGDLDRPGRRANAMRAQFEFAHLNSHSVGELASKAHVKSVLLYHYDPRDKSDEAAYISGVKKYFSGPVFAPADLDRYCFRTAHDEATPGAPVIAPCQTLPVEKPR